jgi:hypothetical protein
MLLHRPAPVGLPKMDDLDDMVVAGHVRRMMVIPAMRRRRLARGYQSRALLRGKPIHGPSVRCPAPVRLV